jgi:hypothetical protein
MATEVTKIALQARSIQSNSSDWNSVRNGGNLVFVEYVPPSNAVGVRAAVTASYWIFRGFLYFDLTNIQAGSRIPGTCSLKLWGIYTSGNPAPEYVMVQKGYQTYPLLTSDYGGSQTNEASDYAHVLNGVWAIGSYNTFTLNAAGIAYVESCFGGYCKLCIRQRIDFENANPGGSYECNARGYDHTESGKQAVLVFTPYKASYPGESLTRASAIRHVYRPGSYRAEVTLGGCSSTISVTEHELMLIDNKPVEVPKKSVEEVKEVVKQVQLEPWKNPPIVPNSDKITMPQPYPGYPDTKKKSIVSKVWQQITPWNEAAGETFPSEVAERKNALTGAAIGMGVAGPLGAVGGYFAGKYWQAITPWAESKGETFGGEVSERVESATKVIKSVLKKLKFW